MSELTSNIRPDRVALGILLVVTSTFLIAIQDVIIKSASSHDISLWQLFVFRSLLLIPTLLAFGMCWGDGAVTWRRALRFWPVCRAGLLILMWVTMYAAIPFVPLSTIAAGVYTAPLFVALLSAPLIGEPVSRAGWLAIVAGFAGVLLIIKPGAASFSWLTVLPVAGGLLYALSAIVTRTKCREIPPSTLAVSLAIALLMFGLVMSIALAALSPAPEVVSEYRFLTGPWGPMNLTTWGIVLGLFGVMAASSLILPAAYQSAPSTIIATFDYFYLIFATLFGFLLFSEVPDRMDVLGMILIVLAGVVVARGR